jgi:carboxymethylenebutenolidase
VTPAIQELIRQNEQLCDGFTRDVLVTHDVDAALAATTEQTSLVNLPMRTGAGDRAELRRYLTEDLIPHLPADLTRRRISRTADRFRVVDELVVGFTHDRELPWLLPGAAATRRAVEVLAISVATVRQGRITALRTLWDQAGLLARLGLSGDAVRTGAVAPSEGLAGPSGWW